MFIYMSAYGLSFGPIIWLYIPEIVDPAILPFCAMMNWVAHTLITTLAEINHLNRNA